MSSFSQRPPWLSSLKTQSHKHIINQVKGLSVILWNGAKGENHKGRLGTKMRDLHPPCSVDIFLQITVKKML